MTIRTRALSIALMMAAAVGVTVEPPRRQDYQDPPAKKPDPDKLSKNQAKAARRAARARKGGH